MCVVQVTVDLADQHAAVLVDNSRGNRHHRHSGHYAFTNEHAAHVEEGDVLQFGLGLYILERIPRVADALVFLSALRRGE